MTEKICFTLANTNNIQKFDSSRIIITGRKLTISYFSERYKVPKVITSYYRFIKIKELVLDTYFVSKYIGFDAANYGLYIKERIF